MLLLGFVLHPNIFSFEIITEATEWAEEWRGNFLFHFGHLLVLFAVPLIIVSSLRFMSLLKGKGEWYGFVGAVLGVFGAFGDQPGQMRYPYDLDLSPDGTLVVCEYEGNRIQWFAKDGRSLRTWGESGRELGKLHKPWGVACAAGGRLCVLDSYNSRVQVVVP